MSAAWGYVHGMDVCPQWYRGVWHGVPWSTYTPLSLSCAPGSGSGVSRPGGEGLVCPLQERSGVPPSEGLVCPLRGESGVPSPQRASTGRVRCALLVGEGLVCPLVCPPPPLTFDVIIIIVILTKGSGSCKYQTSPSYPFDELRRIAT